MSAPAEEEDYLAKKGGAKKVDEPVVEVAPGVDSPDVMTKYKLAGEMTNRVLQKVQAAAVAGAKTIDLCILGDAEIVAETGAVYNKKNAAGEYVKKGIAFPTCVSVNNCVCHNSPLPEDDEIILKDGDLVKIDLAIHLDGYIAPLATSFTVGGPATGRVADALLAAHKAAEVALRMLRPGTKSYAITDAITKVADAFNCKPIEGMLSHTLSQNKIDGEKAIIQAPTPALRKEHKEFVVEENEVYAVDIVMSTGAGKIKEGAQRTTVFKKTDLTYGLKMKSSKSLYYEVNKNFGGMPFCTRACSDIKTAKVGVIECVKHGVMNDYKILWETAGEVVTQFKMLVLVMPSGNMRGNLTGFEESTATSEFSLEKDAEKNADLITCLAAPVGTKSKKKKKKKAAAADAAPAE